MGAEQSKPEETHASSSSQQQQRSAAGNSPAPERVTKQVDESVPMEEAATPPQAPTRAGQAPASHGMGMSRDSSGAEDPISVLSSVSIAQLQEAHGFNVKELSRFLQSLGLREMPERVLEHGINGAVLHSLTAKDIEKMNFRSLGEAKALENFARLMEEEYRKEHRAAVIVDKPMMFWGTAHQWIPGPCSSLNRCSMKDRRSNFGQCCDAICCSPKEFVALPESRLRVHRDHIELTYPKWRDHVQDKFRKTNHAFAATNEVAFKMTVDNIDFTNIADVDTEMVQKKEKYTRTCADCTNVLLCNKLRREPNMGDFYWEGPCQSLCGYDHYYKERPEGQIVITLHRGDENGDKRVIALMEGTEDVAKAIMHQMEEAQLDRQIRLH